MTDICSLPRELGERIALMLAHQTWSHSGAGLGTPPRNTPPRNGPGLWSLAATCGTWRLWCRTALEEALKLEVRAHLEWCSLEQYRRNEINDDHLHDITSCSYFAIPGTVSSICAHAFSLCMFMTKLELPRSIERIGHSSFRGTGLVSVSLVNVDSLHSIGDGAFQLCGALKTIEFPDGLQQIGHNAFRFSGLTHVHLPYNLRSLGMGAFFDCKALETVRLGSLHPQRGEFTMCATIRRTAFLGCESLRVVQLAEGLRRIDQAAFHTCTSMKELHLPASLRSVGRAAFADCGGQTIRDYIESQYGPATVSTATIEESDDSDYMAGYVQSLAGSVS